MPDSTTLRHLVELLETATPVAVACGSAGLSTSTFYEWVARGEAGDLPFVEFSNETSRARGRATQTLLTILWRGAETDWRCAAQLLRLRLRPEIWRDEPPEPEVPEPREVPMTPGQLSRLLESARETVVTRK